MTKFIGIILVLVAVLFVLCGCISPLREQSLALKNGAVADNAGSDMDENHNPPLRKLYVSGAVLNDGYFELPEICDYKAIYNIVGLSQFAAISDNVSMFPDSALKELYIDFVFGDKVCSSINVNGALVTSRMDIYGVSDNVVNILADYIERNGKITNRGQLALALGSDYNDNYYKFYIDRHDYA